VQSETLPPDSRLPTPDSPLTRRLKMNEAYWQRVPADRPLLGVAVNITFPSITFTHRPVEEGRITPDMIDPAQFLSDWDASYRHTERRGEDLFMAACPFAGIPWMEAIAGCQVRASLTSGSIWAEHPDPSWGALLKMDFDPRDPWLLKLIECAGVLRQHAAGRYPICGPILRGVSDMLAALLGTQRMVFEFYDHPDQMRQLIARCTDIWHGVGQALVEAMGRFHGGMCAGRRRVWTPGTCMLYQDDAVSLLSPRFYQEYLVPAAQAILACYDRTMIHVHSGTLPIMLDGLLALDSLDAVEVLLDPTGKRLPELLESLRRILKHKALLICGEMSLAEMQWLMRVLPPAGCCLLPKADAESQADALFSQVAALAGCTGLVSCAQIHI
jgi:hypothetical protein